MNKSNEEQKFITFDDLKFEPYDEYPSFSKRAFLTLDNDLHASVLEYSAEEQERHGCKYGIILRDNDVYPISLGNKSKDRIAGATTDKKLIEMLNVASKFPYDEEDGPYFDAYESEHYKEYIDLIDERDYSKNKPNEEKEFITWDDLKFEKLRHDWDHAGARFDLGSLHIVRIPNDDNSFSYNFVEYSADGKMCTDAYDVRTDNKVFLNKLLRKIQRKYGNGNFPEESIAKKDFTLTIDDLKFDRVHEDLGKEAKVELDTGLTVYVHKLDKELCKNSWNKELAELATEHMYRISVESYNHSRIELEDFKIGTYNHYPMGIFLKDDNELNKALKKICLLDEHGKLPEEKTETLKSAEKEDRAKQSLDRIRTKKKSVSGVYVADKIAEAMRSGVISEPVTPEKGKQLSDNIKKKYIMDQQQKS